MSVARYDLNKCIGCRSCVKVCPMDVFRFDEENHKSVIAFPENCQSCGQCFVNCYGRSLTIVNDMYGYAQTAYRAADHAEAHASSVWSKGRGRRLLPSSHSRSRL